MTSINKPTPKSETGITAQEKTADKEGHTQKRKTTVPSRPVVDWDDEFRYRPYGGLIDPQ